MKKQWECNECHATYKTKDELIQCLEDHLQEAEDIRDNAEQQLEELGN